MPPKALGGPVLDDKGVRDRRARLASLADPCRRTRSSPGAWSTGSGSTCWAGGSSSRSTTSATRTPPPTTSSSTGSPAEFGRSGFHLKALIRTILTSRTYGLSARTNGLNEADSLYFSHAYTKLLPAEVLLDAISTVTGTTTAFEGLPSGMRATQLPDGKMENPFLKTFGRPARELACECERESDSNLSQALQLIGGATVNGKLRDDKGRMAALAKGSLPPEAITRELYIVTLGRDPNSTELAAAVKHLAGAKDRRQAVEDLGWVLINSKEFLFRH